MVLITLSRPADDENKSITEVIQYCNFSLILRTAAAQEGHKLTVIYPKREGETSGPVLGPTGSLEGGEAQSEREETFWTIRQFLTRDCNPHHTESTDQGFAPPTGH